MIIDNNLIFPTNTYKVARRFLFITLSISTIIQLCFADLTNTLSAIIIAFSSWIIFYFILRPNVFTNYILPSFVIISFNFSILSGPLIFQSLSLTPVTFNLTVPLITVSLSSLFQISMMISLLLFRYLNIFKVSNKLRNSINKPLGVMSIPSTFQLWTMGIIGLSCLAWQSTYKFVEKEQVGNIGEKFLEGFTFLAYAPFLIPIIYIVYLKKSISSKEINYLLIYFFILVLVSLAINSRGSLINGIFGLVILFLFFVLTGQISITKKVKNRLFLGFLTVFFLSSQISDLATAMVIARVERNHSSSTEMVFKTFEVFLDKERINQYKNKSFIIKSYSDYSEVYLANPFINRLINIKFFDNIFALSKVMNGDYSDRIKDVTTNKLLALLPKPALDILGISINKLELKFSMGDYMLNLEKPIIMGSFLTGSSVAHGFSMFGYWLFLFIIPLYILLFTIIHSFTIQENKRVFISPVIMISIFSLYFISFVDSILVTISFLFRGLPQTIFIYLLVFFITYLFRILRLKK